MSDTDSLGAEFAGGALRALDVAVLKKTSGGGFIGMERMPEWWPEAFGPVDTFCDRSPFLEDFVEGAASEIWEAADGGKRTLRSGIWEETSGKGESLFFEAIASRGERGEGLLIIVPSYNQWERQQAFIQLAHDENLSRRQLRKELEKKQILLECIMHDLGSPLATVLTNLEHVARHLGDKQQALKSALQQAITQAERQQELIGSIVDVFAADIAGAKSDDDTARILDLSKAVAETVAACAPAAAEKGITLCPFFSESMKVTGDALSLSRVIENLLINAIRHSPEGGKVSIYFENSDGFAICRIEDEGRGIDSGLEDTLFKSFKQGKDQQGRSGLGLYFCRMTVEVWGGSIQGGNRPEGGACFEFRLPLASPAKTCRTAAG